MLSSEWRVKTSMISPISVENPLHQTCLLHLLLGPTHGCSRLGARPASISQLPRDWFAIDSSGGDHETGKMEGRRHHYRQFNSTIYPL
jgi:hypothetical protein